MADYEVTLKVKVFNVEDINGIDDYFHEETKNFLIDTGIIEDAEIVEVRKIDD